MPAESSFDIVSRIDRQEVDNALNQAAKEIGTRFDFRGVGASIAWSGDHAIDIRANSEERAKAVKHAEAFEVCEYGTQPSKEDLKRIFPW